MTEPKYFCTLCDGPLKKQEVSDSKTDEVNLF